MARVTVKTKGFSQLNSKVTRIAKKTLEDQKLRKEIGESLKRKMLGLARQGISPRSGKRFKELKSVTIAQRSRLKKYNRTAAVFSPTRSNLSLSGQLMKSVKVFVVPGKRTITIGPDNSERRGYKTSKQGKAKKPSINNEELGTIHQFGSGRVPARPFLGINEDMEKAARRRIVRFLRRKLAEGFRSNN